MYTESALINNFIKGINPIISFGVDSSFLREVDTPIGIPDIIMIEKIHFEDIKYFTSKFPVEVLTNKYAKVLSVLSKKFHSIQYIIDKCNLSYNSLNKIMKSLMDYSVVESNSSNTSFRLRNDFNIPEIILWSFEFKLNDWKSALRQSLIYRSFCHFPFVIMPEIKKDILLKNISHFERFNIGLCTFNPEDNSISFLVKPKKYSNISKNLYIDAIGRIASKEKSFLIQN